MSVTDLKGQFALDLQGLQRLKHSARLDPESGKQAAAEQFEALFLQMMMKSMREAVPTTGLLSSSQTEMFTSMLDQQWSQQLAGRGMGLAERLVEQLEGPEGPGRRASSQADELIAGIPRGNPQPLQRSPRDEVPGETPSAAPAASPSSQHFFDALQLQRAETASSAEAAAVARPETRAGSGPAHVRDFVAQLAEPARRASRDTGVPAELILAQAALETGWGRREIPRADGGDSHNLFGIKAGASWQGETVDIVTHEYLDGRRQRLVDRFRVYDSFEAAFTDYARLIGDNPRYAGVVAAPDAAQAARALQAGGYATDPAYADKLIAVMDTLGPLEGATTLARR